MLIYERGEYFEQVNKRKKMGRDGEANHVESQLSIPIEKRGQCSLVLRNGAMGARVLVFEILNGPNDLIMDIRQQFSLSALHIQGSLGQKNCNPELGDSHNRTP